MSRAGYSEDLENWDLIRWRGAVTSSLRGKRGQDFLRELLSALDDMPQKRLITGQFITDQTEFCALGTVAHKRGLSTDGWIEDEEYGDIDYDAVTGSLHIANAMAREIMWENDEAGPYAETPEARFVRVRQWVQKQIKDHS